MAERPSLSLAGALWSIAIAALLLAAVVTKPVASSVVSLVLVGHASTALALFLERNAPMSAEPAGGRRFTRQVFAAFLLGEGLGLLAAIGLGQGDLTLWFGLGLSFSVAAMAASSRRAPGDFGFACQVFFHATLLLPLLVAIPVLGLELGRPVARAESLVPFTMNLVARILTVVTTPLLFVALLTELAHHLQRPPDERGTAWAVLVAHQAVFLLILYRWNENRH